MPNRNTELWKGREEKVLINMLFSGEWRVLILTRFNPQRPKTRVYSYLFIHITKIVSSSLFHTKLKYSRDCIHVDSMILKIKKSRHFFITSQCSCFHCVHYFNQKLNIPCFTFFLCSKQNKIVILLTLVLGYKFQQRSALFRQCSINTRLLRKLYSLSNLQRYEMTLYNMQTLYYFSQCGFQRRLHCNRSIHK